MSLIKYQNRLDEQSISELMTIINKLSEGEQSKFKKTIKTRFAKQGIDENIIENTNFRDLVNYPDFINYLGDFFKSNKYHLRAIRCYKKALKINPRNYWANFHIADIYSQHIYANNTAKLKVERQKLINDTINIYDYLIAITFKNKGNTNLQEEYCLRAASYFFERIGKESRAVFINRILAEKGILLSSDKFSYKPIADVRKKDGVQMNPFFEKFALVLEDKELINKYRQQYQEKESLLKNYLIAMTARSGSSWLTELIAATNLAGNPEEWFNYQDNLDGILRRYPCRSFSDYLQCIKVDHSTSNNIFGLEASFPQLEAVLEGSALETIFGKSFATVYLTRNDFIKQAISLYKAVSSGYYHTTQKNKQEIAIPYDNEQIKRWILHLLRQEFFWEQFFKQNGLQPLRVSYEQLVEDPNKTVKQILLHVGVEIDDLTVLLQTQHQKVSNQKSEEMYEQFKQRNQEFIRLCQQYRSSEDILKIR